MKKHVNYERDLGEMAKIHNFKKNAIISERPSISDLDGELIKDIVREFIIDVVKGEYLKTDGYENDLDFALSLTANISYFIIDTVEMISNITERELVLR